MKGSSMFGVDGSFEQERVEFSLISMAVEVAIMKGKFLQVSIEKITSLKWQHHDMTPYAL